MWGSGRVANTKKSEDVETEAAAAQALSAALTAGLNQQGEVHHAGVRGGLRRAAQSPSCRPGFSLLPGSQVFGHHTHTLCLFFFFFN